MIQGPVASRQSQSHPHSAVTDVQNQFVFVVDLGDDAVKVFKFDKTTGSLHPHSTVKVYEVMGVMSGDNNDIIQTKPGSGPRQLAWHPSGKYAYVINELDSTIYVYLTNIKVYFSLLCFEDFLTMEREY